MENMQQAFVSRYAAADGKNHDRNDQRPKIEFFAMPEGMGRIGRFLASLYTQQEEPAVSGVYQGMNSFGNHSRAMGEGGRHEFGYGDGEIRCDSSVDSFLRFGDHKSSLKNPWETRHSFLSIDSLSGARRDPRNPPRGRGADGQVV